MIRCAYCGKTFEGDEVPKHDVVWDNGDTLECLGTGDTLEAQKLPDEAE